MHVFECTPDHEARWNEFVESHPDSAFFHYFGWRRIHGAALGHATHYLMAEDAAGAVAGILPLVHVNSMLFGNTLCSLPFSSNAGPLAKSEAARKALESAARELAEKLAVGVIEYRLLAPSGEARPTKDLYETFSKVILADEDANMSAIRSKQRNIIRKGIKNGLEFGPDSVDRFYAVYAESVRNLGTPVFPRKLFRAILAEFPTSVEIVSATLDGVPVSSAMNFYHRGSVYPYYWGGTAAARDLKGNDFLAWRILCDAAERGCTVFEFGRSKKGTGAYKWKENLGFSGQPLYYEYELVGDHEMPDINPLNPKFKLFVECWKRLPLPVAELVGPWLSRHLG